MYSSRSKGGLWVKGVRSELGIDIFWKPRFEYERGRIKRYDFNGDVESECNVASVEWGDEWVHAGTIELVDEMVELSGIKDFDSLSDGLMRHAVNLITCGYGDSPEEVIDWFSDFDSLKFIVDGEYRIIGSHGDIEELTGYHVNVNRDDGLVAVANIMGAEFEFDLRDNSIITSFIIATIPS